MKKGFIFIGCSIVFVMIGLFVMKQPLEGYSILCFAFAGVLFLVGVSSVFTNSSPTRAYQNRVNSILKTFDSILVKSNKVPSIEGRNVIYVESIDDLIDAQLEIRKPICYMKQTESCSFMLLDDKEAFVYIEKLNPEVVSPVEIEIKEAKLKNKSAAEMDSEMLREIDKTTIVKLSNKKSYKVSPVRKNKNKENVDTLVLEEEPKVEKNQAKNDDIEILDF